MEFCRIHDPRAKLGNLRWGKRKGDFSNGRLTRFEKVQILTNMVRMGALHGIDSLLAKANLLNALGTDLDGLEPPDTGIVRDSADFGEVSLSLEVLRHSWRTYYFGVLLGGYRKLEVDKELLFAASMFHDAGLAQDRSVAPSACCFAIQGAERCKHHLVEKGHDRAKVRVITNAIAVHLNGYVSRKLHGTQAHLLSRGAMCDVFGLGRYRISQTSRKEILSLYPKGDLTNALEIWPDHHLKGTRADFLIGISGPKKGAAGPVRQIEKRNAA